jgi:hypothetical protein
MLNIRGNKMIQVPTVQGGEFAANALLYKQPTPEVINYVNNKLDNIVNHVHGLSSRFKSTVQNLYQQAYNSDIINAAKRYLSQSDYALRQDVIYTIPYEQFNTANLIMQQYIMAEPTLNNLHRKNMCYGFQDTYFDSEPNTYGKERMDYQRVMDGVLQFEKEEDNEKSLAYTYHYSNDDSIELTEPERIAILDTWHEVARMIAEGKDPSEI